MTTLARRIQRLAVTAAGITAACTLAATPATAAHAATGQTAAGSYTPSSNQWYFSQWNIQQQVWPVSEGAGVTVAVLDTGVQASIPDLQGVVQSGGDMVGDSGNGEQDYAPDGGHGTAVASLIAGQGTNGGPVGIAPQAKILPVHVFSSSINLTYVANGIKYAVDHGAQVINMSLGETVTTGTTCDPAVQQAVAYALAHNVVVVAGAGDTNKYGPSPEEPGTCAGVLTVGGVEQDGSLWQFSTQGPEVSVAAPGDHLYTVSSDGQQYSTTSYGTSFAAPLVSAAAALIRSKYPSMPWYTVDQRLIDTAIASGPVPNNGTGYGIINIGKALDPSQFPVSASAPNPVYARYQNYLKSTGQSAGTQPTTGSTSKSGGSGGAVIAIVVVIIIAAIGLVIFFLIRRNSRRGPRNPGGGTRPGPGYPPPGPYGPPPGQQYPRPAASSSTPSPRPAPASTPRPAATAANLADTHRPHRSPRPGSRAAPPWRTRPFSTAVRVRTDARLEPTPRRGTSGGLRFSAAPELNDYAQAAP